MNKDGLDELFKRGVGIFVDPDGEFRKRVEAKAKGEYKGEIVIKLGVDPTRPDIHLGHAVILRKLRQFQDLGCKVVFLIGDVTAQIGDPSGKTKVRPETKQEEIRDNMKTYIEQVGKILSTDEKVFSWITNSDWFLGVTDISAAPNTKVEFDGKEINPNSFLGKAVLFDKTRRQTSVLGKTAIAGFTFLNFLAVLRRITHSQLVARDLFQKRIESGEELYMHEMMYPVLQGVDSVMIARIYGSCDLEIGGTDQTFNMLMGRDVMRASSLPEQAVMALDIIPGTDGEEKMSKSLDNYIAITDAPADMFGKAMSVPDNCLEVYFTLATYTPMDQIKEVVKDLEKGKLHPRDAKLELARQIVTIYHGTEAAQKAEEGFIETFSKGGVPEDVLTVKAPKDAPLAEVLVSHGLVSSKSEFSRLEKAGAIKELEGGVYRVGKHRFIKIERE